MKYLLFIFYYIISIIYMVYHFAEIGHMNGADLIMTVFFSPIGMPVILMLKGLFFLEKYKIY